MTERPQNPRVDGGQVSPVGRAQRGLTDPQTLLPPRPDAGGVGVAAVGSLRGEAAARGPVADGQCTCHGQPDLETPHPEKEASPPTLGRRVPPSPGQHKQRVSLYWPRVWCRQNLDKERRPGGL